MKTTYTRTFGTLYHGTTPENAESIRTRGVEVGPGGAGHGVYLAQTPEEAKVYGEEVIPMALTKGTLIHPEPYEDQSVAHLVGEGTGQSEWDQIPDVLASQGWHGHVDYQGGGEKDHVVVYDPSKIRLV
jgi:hypothetical protein